jgi:hypothetical protein
MLKGQMEIEVTTDDFTESQRLAREYFKKNPDKGWNEFVFDTFNGGTINCSPEENMRNRPGIDD